MLGLKECATIPGCILFIFNKRIYSANVFYLCVWCLVPAEVRRGHQTPLAMEQQTVVNFKYWIAISPGLTAILLYLILILATGRSVEMPEMT